MRLLIRFGAWWAASFVLWLLLTSSLDAQEVVAGVIASSISAFAVSIVQSKQEFGFRPRLRWLAWARFLPGQVVVDCWLLSAALWRRLASSRQPRGSFKTFAFPHVENDPESAARRALVTAALSLAPNSYVIAFDRAKQEVIVHQLVSHHDLMEKVLGDR